MCARFVAIDFPYLKTDWISFRHPELRDQPLVVAAPDHARLCITASNVKAEQAGIFNGMPVADARAIVPGLQVIRDREGLDQQLLARIAEGCIRYTPAVALDGMGGLLLDSTGCAHLWGDEKNYLADIAKRLAKWGYQARLSMADTAGAAWGMSRFGATSSIIPKGAQQTALLSLPPACLRLDAATLERLQKLGLRTVRDFISMPRTALRRRFGNGLLLRLDQALGKVEEPLSFIQPVTPYQERLPSLEPIVTATGIDIALQQLLDVLCERLRLEGQGIRSAVFTCFRVDGHIQRVTIGTHRSTHNAAHLFKLFSNHTGKIEPDLGIEVFVLEALKTEPVTIAQQQLWTPIAAVNQAAIGELADRITARFGAGKITRYLPAEHYWPENSIREAASLEEKSTTEWIIHQPRPLYLLSLPERIEVAAPIPDYPPLHFRYKNKLHTVCKADGPERIEQEWWLNRGEHRDYYTVEDEEGKRYWLFRLGHYSETQAPGWYLHGFFA